MNRKEEILHQSISETWNNHHRKGTTEYSQKQRLICHWNNAESSNGGNKMISMGVKKGVADWQYLKDNGTSVWIELKTETGVQSEDQKRFEELCRSLGHEYMICRDEKSFWDAIDWHPITTPHLQQKDKIF